MSDDLISRSELKKMFEEKCGLYCRMCDEYSVFENGVHYCRLIDIAPTVPQTQITVFTEYGNKEELEKELQRVLLALKEADND